jgi:hypothetical protein
LNRFTCRDQTRLSLQDIDLHNFESKYYVKFDSHRERAVKLQQTEYPEVNDYKLKVRIDIEIFQKDAFYHIRYEVQRI